MYFVEVFENSGFEWIFQEKYLYSTEYFNSTCNMVLLKLLTDKVITDFVVILLIQLLLFINCTAVSAFAVLELNLVCYKSNGNVSFDLLDQFKLSILL